MKDQKIADVMELNKESIVLLFGTEGATDPEIYSSIVSV
jgi:phosphatidate phosphatase APP1